MPRRAQPSTATTGGLTRTGIQCECLPGQSTRASDNKRLSNFVFVLHFDCFCLVHCHSFIIDSIIFYKVHTFSSWFALLVRRPLFTKKHPPAKTPALYYHTVCLSLHCFQSFQLQYCSNRRQITNTYLYIIIRHANTLCIVDFQKFSKIQVIQKQDFLKCQTLLVFIKVESLHGQLSYKILSSKHIGKLIFEKFS